MRYTSPLFPHHLMRYISPPLPISLATSISLFPLIFTGVFAEKGLPAQPLRATGEKNIQDKKIPKKNLLAYETFILSLNPPMPWVPYGIDSDYIKRGRMHKAYII